MKYKLENLASFKALALSRVLEEWQRQADSVEADFNRKIEEASDAPIPYAGESQKERLTQDKYIALYGFQKPIQELQSVLKQTLPDQTDNAIHPFSIFDLTRFEEGSQKVITYFVLPIHQTAEIKTQVSFNQVSLNLLFQDNALMGKKAGDEWKYEGGEIFEEIRMGHLVSTGRFAKPERFKISHIYR
jgi:hypothetical protein